MYAPILTILVSVGLGCVLALAPGRNRQVGGLMRTFAVAAAIGVVVLHLAPHAFEMAGWPAVVVGGVAFVATPWLERASAALVRRGRDASPGLSLEAAYAALLVHRVGDGAAMAVGQRHGVGVLLALGAHAMPVVAFVVLAFAAARGLTHGLLRALGLAVASVVGVALVSTLPALTSGLTGAYMSALVAGTLLHVVAHELRTDPPQGVVLRVLDLVFAGVGLVTAILPELVTTEHGHHAVEQHGTLAAGPLGHQALELTLRMSPAVVVGLVLCALLVLSAPRCPTWGARPLPQILAGVWHAARRQLETCSRHPTARRLNEQGAPAAFVGAFATASTEVGLLVFVLSMALLGVRFAVLRLAAVVLLALVVGLVCAAVGPRPVMLDRSPVAPHGEPPRGLGHVLDELFVHVSGWLGIGVLGAAYVGLLLPHAEGTPTLWGALGLAALVALVSLVSVAAATPIAAVVVAQGMSPGLALGALLVGTVANPTTVRVLAAVLDRRALIAALGGATAVAGALGYGLDRWLSSSPVMEPGVVGWVSLGIVVLWWLRITFRVGVRAWLADVFEPTHDSPRHVHVHGSGLHDPSVSHDWEQWHDHGCEGQGHTAESFEQSAKRGVGDSAPADDSAPSSARGSVLR